MVVIQTMLDCNTFAKLILLHATHQFIMIADNVFSVYYKVMTAQGGCSILNT